MARQHFYSRVPARVSLYNKRDSFDTFAKSEGLSDALVLGELSAVYAEKLDIHDSVRVRRGEIPTVYSQMRLSGGDVVHTAVRYLPTDFTGERSAYIAHSQILTDDEKREAFYNPEAVSFNPNLFITDTTAFNFTARNAAPNPVLPDRAYSPILIADPKPVIAKYDSELMKCFLFSIISSLCDGGREVWFRLPTDDSRASVEALSIINSVMRALPSEMREMLSFVSFVSNPNSYQGFKLKCVSNRYDIKIHENAVFFDFVSGEMRGEPNGFKQSGAVASFLYTLLGNKTVRDEFHAFISRIVAKYGMVLNTVKDFSDIVFLFWQCSGFYLEDSVLPNDETLAGFLDIYGKYREGLIPAHRVQALRPLSRYSRAQIAIPDTIFVRLTGLYPGECTPAKAVALDVALSLIHVDLMRDKLFALIKENYSSEIDRVKKVVIGNLSRVFYGGFLQKEILSFFDSVFYGEPIEMKEEILDKLLLSIRTPEIQKEIVDFIEKHYGEFTPEQKMKISVTCLEMMPECDRLSSLFVGFINRRIGLFGDELASMMATKLAEQLDAFLRANDSRYLAILMQMTGFAEDVAVKHILTGRIGGEIFIDVLASMPAHIRAEKLLRIRKSVPSLSDEDYGYLLGTFTEVSVTVLPSTMYDMLKVDATAEATLPAELCEKFRTSIIYPTIVHTFFDVFKLKYGRDGIQMLLSYAKGRAQILSSPQYAVVVNYVKMTKHCMKGRVEEAFKIAENLPDSDTIRRDIADHILMCSLDSANQREVTTFAYELIINYLKGVGFKFDQVYSKYKKHFHGIREDESNVISAKLDPPDRRGACDAAEILMYCVLGICEASSLLADMVCAESSGLKKALAEFFEIYGVGAAIFLKKNFKEGYFGVVEVIDGLVDDRNSNIKSFDDAVDLIFRRK